MGGHLHQLVLAGICLICLGCLGCLPLPYSQPEVENIAPIEVRGPIAPVFVFRADVEEAEQILPRHRTVKAFEFTRLEPSSQGVIPGQSATGPDGRLFVSPWDLSSEWKTTHLVSVRLYRRGFRTIVITHGTQPREIEWVEISHLADQEQAVDDLLGSSPLDAYQDFSTPREDRLRYVKYIRRTLAHCENLLIAAREYESLASQVPPDDLQRKETRERLLEKANLLKGLAQSFETDCRPF